MEAVILAAGKGTRMRPYSNAVNKEMCLIGYYPVIEYAVRGLASAGIEKIYIVLGERKSQIMEYLRDGKWLGVKIAYLYQDMSHGAGTAKAVETAEDWVSEDFIVVYGDTFFHPTEFFKNMIEYHKNGKAHATVGVYPMGSYREYGIVKVDENARVLDILEKPSEEEAEKAKVGNVYLVNSGPIIFSLHVFKYIKKTPISPAGEYWITDTIKLMVNDELNVLAYRIPESVFWRDIGRPETRIEAEKYVQEIGLVKA